MEHPATDQAIGEVWRVHRSYLVNLSARTLGDRTEAEDVVQEAFGRLAAVPLDDIDDVRAWLTVVVRRLSLNRLRSAYRRREEAVGAGGDDAGANDHGNDHGHGRPPADPADRVTLDDQVQQALAVVLDRLTPPERTAFVLHDVFGFPFDAVAEIVGRTTAACRQLASRARRSVRADAPPLAAGPASTSRQRDLAERFASACAGGDITELMAVLDPDVVGDARLIGGGVLSHLEGVAAVAWRIIDLFGPDSGTTLVPFDLEDDAGAVAFVRGAFATAIRLEQRGDRIHHIHAFVLRPS
jgi:RNA polymerase sigma-70 factor (ECF subfamily)